MSKFLKMTAVGAMAMTAPAIAQVSPATQMASAPVSRTIPWLGGPSAPRMTKRTVEVDYRYRLAKLRDAMLKQQADDGGRLKAENAARFQARLDKINRTRVNDLATVEHRRI